MSTQVTCEGCYHANKNGNCGTDQECSLCIRNPSLISSRILEKEVEIDGIKFKAPMDMYIAKDRMKFEDYMRTKRIIEAIDAAKRTRPTQWPERKDDNPWYVPPQPYYPFHPQYPVYWAKTPPWQTALPNKWQKKTTSDQ